MLAIEDLGSDQPSEEIQIVSILGGNLADAFRENVDMTPRISLLVLFAAERFLFLTPYMGVRAAEQNSDATANFKPSERCIGCHNNLKTAKGQDVSIGSAWRASMMANSARDPYWQGSVRREAMDHPESSAEIENECATCHMPLQRLADKATGQETTVFSRMQSDAHHAADAAAADGVGCNVCHQVKPEGLGEAATYNGAFAVAASGQNPRPLYGPWTLDARATSMHVSTAGLTPTQSEHIRQAGLCGSCHTLYTTTLGPGGKPAGQFPEQMSYLEWLHSEYREKRTCQQCHMPQIDEAAPAASLGAQPREGVHGHSFVGANFFVEEMLNAHRDELAVTAQPAELVAASSGTRSFLATQAARVVMSDVVLTNGRLSFAVKAENLTGHKLPTAFPSRRAWLHVTVTDVKGTTIFESGRLNADGSIVGNANDADPAHFSPHYPTITAPDQVEIFEPILGDTEGHVTTGLLSATHYLKDNRLLPVGFDKGSASADIAVVGEAAQDPAFTGGSVTTRYQISTSVAGPFHIVVDLLYQPVGFRWAQNLTKYSASEPKRFVGYFGVASARSSQQLAQAQATVQ
jgi:hypothetical protein